MVRYIKKCVFPFFFLLFVPLVCSSTPQLEEREDRYNLNFSRQRLMEDPIDWSVSGIYDLNVDSMEERNGKNPVVFSNYILGLTKAIKIPFPLQFNVFQTLHLPYNYTDDRDWTCKVTLKKLNIPRVYFRLFALDDKDEVVFTDSITISEAEDWTDFKISASGEHKNVSSLFVQLQVEDVRGETSGVQRLWIDRFSVNTHDYDLEKVILKDLLEDVSWNPAKMQRFDSFDSELFDQMDSLKSKKIIAIGESVHGSLEFYQLGIELIKYQIINNNCRSVLLELPLDLGLKWDLFLSQETSYTIAEFVEDFSFVNFSTEEWTDFLLWLKEFNKNREDKVRLWGIDIIEDLLLNKGLQSYYSEKARIDSVFSPLISIGTSRDEVKEGLNYITSEAFLSSPAGKDHYDLSYHLLSTPTSVPENLYAADRRFLSRDSLMYQNSLFALSYLKSTQTAIFCSHFGHAKRGYLYGPKYPSAGHLLNQRFKEDYYVIGLFGGAGESISYSVSEKNYRINSFSSPLIQTINGLPDEKTSFYYTITEDHRMDKVLIRWFGANPQSTEGIHSMKSTFDAYFFLKKITPVDMTKKKSFHDTYEESRSELKQLFKNKFKEPEK